MKKKRTGKKVKPVEATSKSDKMLGVQVYALWIVAVHLYVYRSPIGSFLEAIVKTVKGFLHG